MIYLISDTHFNHTNIIKYCNRPFKNIEEMNQALINNWNRVVNDKDIIYHCGDFSFGKAEDISSIVSQLNGKIYLTRGNHDRGWFKECGFEDIQTMYELEYKGLKLLLRHKPIYVNGYDKIICGHTHEKNIPDNRLVNVSVEQINYTPISIDTLIEMIKIKDNIISRLIYT